MLRPFAFLTLFTLAFGNSAPLAQAAYITEVESNNSLAAAQSLDTLFDLAFDANIGDKVKNTSTLYKHASVRASGEDSVTFDYFSFTVLPHTTKVIFDIDDTSWTHNLAFDTRIFLYRADGGFVAENDNATALTDGDRGSTRLADSYLEVTGLTPGVKYVIGVARDDSIALAGRIGGSAAKVGDEYTLHISQVPEPQTLVIFGLAAFGIIAFRRSAKS